MSKLFEPFLDGLFENAEEHKLSACKLAVPKKISLFGIINEFGDWLQHHFPGAQPLELVIRVDGRLLKLDPGDLLDHTYEEVLGLECDLGGGIRIEDDNR